MSNSEIMKELYYRCKEMNMDEMIEIILNAETKEEQDFYDMVSNYILQEKQRKVISQGRF